MCPIISAVNRDSQGNNFHVGEKKKTKKQKPNKKRCYKKGHV